ncbi:MAG: ABC transporter permease subunit, partial [Alphaproteobacteria bacterium]|nr:ABC transporter permease subunit [Alphaproteobacteria bacterium]
MMSYQFDWSVLWTYRLDLLEGAGMTLLLSLAGLTGAVMLGVIAGTGSLSKRAPLRRAAIAYVEGTRNVPLLVHIYLWYLGLSSLRLPAFWCASLALAIYSGA